jgi:hypothetical protein
MWRSWATCTLRTSRYVHEVGSDGCTIHLPKWKLRCEWLEPFCHTPPSLMSAPEPGELSYPRKRAHLRQRFPAERSIFRAVYSLYGINDGTEMSKNVITSWTSSAVFFLDRMFVTCYFIYVLSTSDISLNTETDWLQDGTQEFLYLTGRNLLFTTTSTRTPVPCRWPFSCCNTARADQWFVIYPSSSRVCSHVWEKVHCTSLVRLFAFSVLVSHGVLVWRIKLLFLIW